MKHKPTTTTTTLLLFLLLLSRKRKRRLMVVAKLLVKKEKKRRGHPSSSSSSSSSSFLLPSDYLEGPFFRLPRKRERRKDNDFLLSLSLQLLYLQCIVGRSLPLFSGTKREERRALEVRLRHRCFSSSNRNTPGLMRWTTLRVSVFRGRLRGRGGIWAKEIWKIRSFPRSLFPSLFSPPLFADVTKARRRWIHLFPILYIYASIFQLTLGESFMAKDLEVRRCGPLQYLWR